MQSVLEDYDQCSLSAAYWLLSAAVAETRFWLKGWDRFLWFCHVSQDEMCVYLLALASTLVASNLVVLRNSFAFSSSNWVVCFLF